MEKSLIIIILFTLLLSPISHVSAQTTDRDALIEQLQGLLIQLANLQEQLRIKQQGRVLGIETTQLNPSTYYDGSYVAIYLIEGILPVPYRGTITTKRDIALWNILRDVLGDQVTSADVSELRIYNQKNSQFDAFVEQIGSQNSWVFGINIAYVDVATHSDRENAIELLVHEYAHILYQYHPKVAKEFVHTYWAPKSRNTRSYVSEYAMISEDEDFAETFAYFVLNPKLQGSSFTDEKIRFFYDFDSFRDIRENIRDRLFN